MTSNWPTADLDPVRRLRVLTAGVRGAAVTERVVDAPLDTVWAMLSDLEGSFRELQPDMRTVTVLTCRDGRVEALARSRFGMRAHFDGTLRPGWCWLQSRFLIVAMAAAAEPDGRTRVALTGGIRLPRRGGILPIGVRREANRSLDRLEHMVER